MTPDSTPPGAWTERYEALRRCAQEGASILASRPLGWNLLARHGMAGWMRSWTDTNVPVPVSSAASGPPPHLPAPLWQNQLTMLLARMTAAHLQTQTSPER